MFTYLKPKLREEITKVLLSADAEQLFNLWKNSGDAEVDIMLLDALEACGGPGLTYLRIIYNSLWAATDLCSPVLREKLDGAIYRITHQQLTRCTSSHT